MHVVVSHVGASTSGGSLKEIPEIGSLVAPLITWYVFHDAMGSTGVGVAVGALTTSCWAGVTPTKPLGKY